jgi:hypothetical protein
MVAFSSRCSKRSGAFDRKFSLKAWLLTFAKQISAEWKKPKDTSKCVVSYKAAVAGSSPWAERQFESVENQEVIIGDSANGITDGLERAIEQVFFIFIRGARWTCFCVQVALPWTWIVPDASFLQLVKGQSAFVKVRADYAYGDAGLNDKVKCDAPHTGSACTLTFH